MLKKNNRINVAEEQAVSQRREAKGRNLNLILGLVGGVLLTVLVGWQSMPSMMLATHQSRYDTVQETCIHLKAAIEENGWSCPAIRDMNLTMEKHGVTMARPVKIVELCKAEYARDVLLTNPEVSTLMPCAWGVYEGDDGKIYISGMNMALMGKMFGGNIAKVMGDLVVKDEARILEGVI
jgi:uncharacterized protein (DUF302 family)